MNNYRNNKQGFSLVKISIVCAILGILLLPVFVLMSKSSSGTIRNRNEILAQQYASNVIAFCNIIKFDCDFLKETEEKVIVPGEMKVTVTNDLSIDMDITEDNFNKIATRTISIKNFNSDDTGNIPSPFKYKIVTVKVEWLQPGETVPRNVTVTGLVYNI